MRRRGVVVITATQFHSRKPELRFCAGSNPARCVPLIDDGEDLWQWSRLEIELNTFHWSTILQKQFIIIIIIIIRERMSVCEIICNLSGFQVDRKWKQVIVELLKQFELIFDGSKTFVTVWGKYLRASERSNWVLWEEPKRSNWVFWKNGNPHILRVDILLKIAQNPIVHSVFWKS